MIALASLLQRWRRFKPKLLGICFKLIHGSSNVQIGHRFRIDAFPDLLIDPTATLIIGDDVILRKDVEIRVHKNAKVEIQSGCRVDRGVRLLAANQANVRLSSFTRVGLYSVLNGGDDIFVGEKVLISGFVYLQTSMHRHKASIEIKDQGFDHAPVIVEDDAWLGAHVVVMPGITVGKGAVVGSNAVVTKSVAAGQIVAGVPAKMIRRRE